MGIDFSNDDYPKRELPGPPMRDFHSERDRLLGSDRFLIPGRDTRSIKHTLTDSEATYIISIMNKSQLMIDTLLKEKFNLLFKVSEQTITINQQQKTIEELQARINNK